MAKHTHRYERRDIGVKSPYLVYACTLPDCNHYLHPSLIPGKMSLCWHCGNPFQILKAEAKRPKCVNCIRPKDVNLTAAEKSVEAFLGDLESGEDNDSGGFHQ